MLSGHPLPVGESTPRAALAKSPACCWPVRRNCVGGFCCGVNVRPVLFFGGNDMRGVPEPPPLSPRRFFASAGPAIEANCRARRLPALELFAACRNGARGFGNARRCRRTAWRALRPRIIHWNYETKTLGNIEPLDVAWALRGRCDGREKTAIVLIGRHGRRCAWHALRRE